jgi:predicted TIM-barrel fold metal-dependent hydrolase
MPNGADLERIEVNSETAGMPLIDAHMHLWDLDRLRYDWLTPPFGSDGPNGNVAAIARTYLPEDYRVEAASWNVVGTVHVEAGANPADPVAETDWLQSFADAGPGARVIVAHAALDDLRLETVLAAHAARPGVRGIRHIVNWHADPRRTYTPTDLTLDPAWRAGFARLADFGLSFDLQAYPHQFDRLADLIAAHPAIPVIVNHAGMGVDGPADWLSGMQRLAQLPQVAVKLSGLGFVWRTPDEPAMRERIQATVELFGPNRVMVGSDFPTDRLFGSFDATLGRIAAALSPYSEAARRAMFAGNANRIYRMGLEI